MVNSDDIFESEINKQVESWPSEQADEILFVVDAMNGVTDLDDHVAEILRKSRKPVIWWPTKSTPTTGYNNVPGFTRSVWATHSRVGGQRLRYRRPSRRGGEETPRKSMPTNSSTIFPFRHCRASECG